MANGGHGATGANGARPPANCEQIMREIGLLHGEMRHVWRILRAMETHEARLSAQARDLDFVWRDIEVILKVVDEIKRRLFNVILGLAASASGVILAIVLTRLGLS